MNISGLFDGVDMLDMSGDTSSDISDLCYDSRMCEEGAVFVAVTGGRFDGHDFIAGAIERGARCVVYEKKGTTIPAGTTAIRVKDSRLALATLGKNFYGNPSRELCLIGVTGTNGKTTVTYLLESILQSAGFSVGVIGTVNYRYGESVFPAPHTTPESVDLQRTLREMVDTGVTHVVMEVSSHAIDLKRVYGCEYDLGIFTNLSSEHLDYHRTMEEYFLVKKRFFDDLITGPTAVVNGDDPWGVRIGEEIRSKVVSVGTDRACDVSATDVALSLSGIDARVLTADGELCISSALTGRFNLSNILTATAAALAIGIPADVVQTGIRTLKIIPGRLEHVSEPGQPVVFVDYAHTGDALEKVLAALSEFRKRKLVTVFGCGGDRDRTKRPEMGRIATAMSDLTIITSDNPRTEDPLRIIEEIEGGVDAASVRYAPEEVVIGFAGKGYTILPDRKTAINLALSVADDEDIVLIAGKGHEDYQIVGDRKFSFDDRVIAREALCRRGTGGAA